MHIALAKQLASWALIIGLFCACVVDARIDFNTNIDCNAWKYKCGFLDNDCTGKMSKKKMSEFAAGAFASYTESMEKACANDPRRMEGREFIDRALQTLFSNGILTRQQWEQSGVQVRFCGVLKGITIKIPQINLDVEWRATGMAPSPNKILLSTELLNYDFCSEEHIKFFAGVLFHEWHHLQQQRVWGLTGFQCRYLDEIIKGRGTVPETGNTIELDADRRENEALERIDEIEVTSCRTKPRCGGSARDVSVGGVNGDVWIVDNDRIPQSNVLGGMIRRHTGGTTWDWVVPHVRAIRIAVAPDGTVWYVDGIGDVYSVSGNTVVKRGGSARTVAVGANGDVWIVDNEQISESNWAGGMIRRNTGGTSWNEIRTDIRAVEIAVAPDGSLWMVNGIGEVHALLKSEGFLKLVGGSARDIAVGATGEVWIVDNDAIAESNADGGMIRRYTGGTSWGDLRSQVRAVRIAVAPDGTVWTVNGRGVVTTPLRSGADVACLPRSTPAPRPRPTPSPPRKRNFVLENKCRWTTIRAAIRYKDMTGDWVSKCWWNLDPGDEIYLNSNGQMLETINSVWYVYAESTDGDMVWSGTDNTRSCGGQSLDMSKSENIDNYGRLYASFRCNDELRPTAVPPRRQPTPSPDPFDDLWDAYNGYACRVQGSDSGKKGVDFEKYEGDHVDFYWCLSECADKDYCRGFEYRYDNEEGIGKCEIWLRYYGNVEEYIGPNYHYCYWKKKSNGYWNNESNGGGGTAVDTWKKHTDTACGFGGNGEENIDFLKRYDVSRDWCKSRCLEIGGSCHGYDYHHDRKRCRVFYRKTTDNVDKDGVDCWLKQGPSNTAVSPNRVPGGDCAVSGKKSQACGGPSDKPAVCCEPDRGCDEKRCK